MVYFNEEPPVGVQIEELPIEKYEKLVVYFDASVSPGRVSVPSGRPPARLTTTAQATVQDRSATPSFTQSAGIGWNIEAQFVQTVKRGRSTGSVLFEKPVVCFDACENLWSPRMFAKSIAIVLSPARQHALRCPARSWHPPQSILC